MMATGGEAAEEWNGKKRKENLEMERDRLTRTLLELLDPAMPEVHVIGMTCHLHKLTLVVFLSPEKKKKVKAEKDTIWSPGKMTRLSLHGYGWKSWAWILTLPLPIWEETWTATYVSSFFSSYYRKFEIFFISLSSGDYMHVKSSLKVQIKGSYSLKFFHIMFFPFTTPLVLPKKDFLILDTSWYSVIYYHLWITKG